MQPLHYVLISAHSSCHSSLHQKALVNLLLIPLCPANEAQSASCTMDCKIIATYLLGIHFHLGSVYNWIRLLRLDPKLQTGGVRSGDSVPLRQEVAGSQRGSGLRHRRRFRLHAGWQFLNKFSFLSSSRSSQ